MLRIIRKNLQGFTEATWEADYAKYKNNWKGACRKMMDNNNDRDNSVPCGCCSAIICSFLGTGRIGKQVQKRHNLFFSWFLKGDF